jgi:hypothetical protein
MDWQYRNSNGTIKTRGSETSDGTHPGYPLSWQEQLATHTEKKILEKFKSKNVLPGEILSMQGSLPPCNQVIMEQVVYQLFKNLSMKQEQK